MSLLQIRLSGPDFSSFSPHSHNYEPSNLPKSVLKHPNFRYGPYSPTGSWGPDPYVSGPQALLLGKQLRRPARCGT
jgi:hypothetical protein